jgi:Tfp pilus assembly protein PilV
MKSNLMRTFLEWALITSVLTSVGFFAWFYVQSRALRETNSRMTSAQLAFQNNRAVMAMLLTECREYAKTNAELARLLETGKAQPTAAPAAPAPVNKPRTK